MPAKKKLQVAKQAGKKKDSEPLASRLLNLPVIFSLGMLDYAEEQLTDIVESLTKRGEKTQKASQKYLKKLMKRGSEQAKKAPQKVQKKVEKAEPKREEWILRALHRLNIPTSSDIAALDKRVDALLKKVA